MEFHSPISHRGRRVALVLFTLMPFISSGWSQDRSELIAQAAGEMGRQAAADLLGDPHLVSYQRVGIVVRDGEGAEALAEALRDALIAEGRSAPPLDEMRAAAERLDIAWATAAPMTARDIALLIEAVAVDGLIAVRTTAMQPEARRRSLEAQLALADPTEVGRPWSVEVQADLAERTPVRRSFWQSNPEVVIGLIVAAVALYLFTNLRRRRGA